MTNSNLITEANLETRPKLEGGKRFVLDTEFHPAGDQPTAILELTKGISGGELQPRVALQQCGVDGHL